MLQIKKISKQYKTNDLVQDALKEVSLNLRDNEFVAILGPSGSGKTTLLNIIGGLDRYDSGDLVINEISTKKYTDRDWDSYRNHTIGFVFQSYNLIPHQTVLANVELALTISGISKSERKKQAIKALEQVGLGDQLHKKPNQMSGGQMQRVAIARALVNNPDILLADEPTGALDSETSIQVMELLKEVAKDRLVVMVTHNPELAEQYATRIVKLRDGKIQGDSDPYTVDNKKLAEPMHKNMGKASMSFFTALSLSFNNLRTKKGRTLLTSFAGSIGIIGIALILSLSTGVNTYITDLQRDTMTSYPISIEAQTIDLNSMMETGRSAHGAKKEITHERDGVYSDGTQLEMASTMTSNFKENNLTEFKKYLDNPDSEIHQYVGENGIAYSYNTGFNVYVKDPDGTLINTDGSSLREEDNMTSHMMSAMSAQSQNKSGGMSMMRGSTNNFDELLPGTDGKLVGAAITDNYDVLYGAWPQKYDEVVLALDANNEISATALYELGLLPAAEYKELMEKIENGEEVKIGSQKISYEEICKQSFRLVPACDMYVKNANGTYTLAEDDSTELTDLLEDAVEIKVTGIIRPKENVETVFIHQPIGYTKALTDYLMDYTNNSEIVKAQQNRPEVNVINGMKFSPADDSAKIADAKTYLSRLTVSEKAALYKSMAQGMAAGNPQLLAQMTAMGEVELAAALDQYLQAPEDDMLLSVYDMCISAGTYDKNMESFGVTSLDAPSAISIYTDSFEDKDAVSECIEAYNETVEEENQITYTDYVGLLMSSITTIINVVTYVLIAFVAVSLVVSSIMIGIITYISVLERTKEIGILRAIGASKHNVSQVFNAETFIIGLCSGLIGIGVTLLLLIPANAIIHAVTETTQVNAILPITGAVILIVLSVVLTLIGGFIPAKKAAKKDPVTALRTE